jgi:guanylate kinase
MEEVTMRLIVITGTCGAGKSTIKDELETYLDPSHYLCLDTDELGINWWDYAGTDHEYRFSDDCLKEAVRRANGRDLVFSSCLNPQDYLEKHTISNQIESTYFIVLCPADEKIEERLRARPKERGFDSDEAIRPQIAYNQWFRKNKGKVPLFLDNSDVSVEETAKKIVSFITSLPK